MTFKVFSNDMKFPGKMNLIKQNGDDVKEGLEYIMASVVSD